MTQNDLFNNSGHMIKIISNKLKPMVWILATILTTLFFSCEKDDDPFKECRKHPDCEYFTCKIDGKRWEPQCDGGPLFGCTPWDVQYYRKTSGNLSMSVENEENNQFFKFVTKELKLKIGNNKLYIDEDIQTRFSNLNLNDSCIRYKLDTFQPYSFNVTKIDTINYYLSAYFSFIGKNDCGDEVIITDGEFNLPYRF